MQREIIVAEVRSTRTQGGSVRWIVRDAEGNEYSTFREQVATGLRDLEGTKARIVFHEQHRGQYTNVYLDSIEPVEARRQPDNDRSDADPERSEQYG